MIKSDEDSGAPVCVLGASAKWSLFGSANALGEYVKVNEQWFRVIGSGESAAQFRYRSCRRCRLWTQTTLFTSRCSRRFSALKTATAICATRLTASICKSRDTASIPDAAQVTRAILDSSHHGADDFSIIVPAELLAEQQRTEQLFNIVMVAIASISLLVGGIGIMNIMLASILERTREIGLRRAVGARQSDIVRQFVVEATMISFAGGSIGVVLGFCNLPRDRVACRMVNDRHIQFHRAGIPCFDFGWLDFWNLSGHKGRPARSGRGNSLRVT